MLKLQTSVAVDRITGSEIFDFLVDPNDRAYQTWWPGVHLHLRRLEGNVDHVGDVLYMDEYVGKRRLRLTAIVLEAVPGRRLVWQFKRVVKLPARLSLEFADREGGVEITHTIEAGFTGVGSLLDSLFRLYFTKEFARALDDHVKTEFPLLRDRFADVRAAAAAASPT